MTIYSRIVFLTGDDYPEFEAQLDKDWELGLEYLKQWDNGEDDDTHSESSAGLCDDYYYFGMGDWDYLMTWNRALGYASLQRVIYSDSFFCGGMCGTVVCECG